jgi:hypothetical protein
LAEAEMENMFFWWGFVKAHARENYDEKSTKNKRERFVV